MSTDLVSEKKLKAKLNIRGLEISPPIALAPMVGISHSAFRSLVQTEGGVGVLFTEMLAAKRLPHDNILHSPLLTRDESEKPLIYQIIGSDETVIAPAVKKLHALGADGIDLNLGCPAPSQRKQGAGLHLASDFNRLGKVLQCLRKSSHLPISVKIRLGQSLDIEKLCTFCIFLEAEGVDMITVHCRLNGEKFCRKPRWSVIAEIKKVLSIPVLANGGIFTVTDAKRCLEQSKADGLMIGRGGVRQPWLCRDIAEDIYDLSFSRPPREPSEVYFHFINMLEKRFSTEKRLGRLILFTRYFAATFKFGHQLISAIQNCRNMEQACIKAENFFSQKSF